ncbi:hypothetical protein SAMN05518801_10927 [Novosphingobium sp. CF614]|uniref:ATP-binding protein n=1 Tax=Novosphingobium sp. CF614 TaxID=1884364 RepID=UPI0008DF12D3|nr:ATP-binding protein [Novosphingobium sp. CF614]SFG17099.1 hypothetical protein SAMN05518801_10927 [Novosphingobium sp. CF614]
MSTGSEMAEALDRLKALLEESQGNVALATSRLADAQSGDTSFAFGNHLAGVRWIDEALYEAKFAALPSAPPFRELVGPERPWFLPDRLVAHGAGRFGWAGDAAFERDLDWARSDPAAHQAWHLELERYFAGIANPLDQIYHAHLAGAGNVAELFRAAFGEAAARMDIPQLNAILQAVRRPPPATNTPLFTAVREAEAFFAGRSLFRRDYQLTARFFEREVAFRSFGAVLAADQRWIWHLHASGGVGKTTFLRWLISRHLLETSNSAICARIDFDDYRLDSLVEYPLRAMADILRQIDRQLPDTGLQMIVSDLDGISSEPGWNEVLLDGVLSRLDSIRIERAIVVVLDTLEDATRTQAAWLRRLVQQIARLRTGMPRLKLILSGRYDFTAGLPEELRDAVTVHELDRFSPAEAEAYLERIEGIASPDLRRAMLERVAVEEVAGPDGTARFNPFKLSLLGQIIRNDPGMDVERVLRMESVDLAYLIERVILRIQDQSLRWLIRYAVVARQLDRGFLENVLLPELREVLAGGAGYDQVDRDALGTYKGEDIWRRDPEAAKGLDAEALLDRLRGYASDRGWISVDSGGAVVRLHPEVVEPTRKLLAHQRVYVRLHERAIAYARGLAKDRDQWAAAQALLVFHHYQLDSRKGLETWQAAMEEACKFGCEALIAVAREIQAKEYDGCDPALVADSHIIIARAMVEQAILMRGEDHALRAGIANHVEHALELAVGRVDPAYVALADVMMDRSGLNPPSGIGTLAPEAPVYLKLATAWRQSLVHDWAAWHEAMEQIASARGMKRRTTLLTLDGVDLAFWMNDIAREAQSLDRARSALLSIGKAGGKRRTGARALRRAANALDVAKEAEDLERAWGSLRAVGKVDAGRLDGFQLREAANALLAHDPRGAALILDKFKRPLADPRDDEMLLMLLLDRALVAQDLDAAAAAVMALWDAPEIGAGTRIDAYAKAGFAAALAGNFTWSEDLFRHADRLIESTDNAASSGKVLDCLLLRARAALRGMRNPGLAQRLLDTGTMSRGRRIEPDYEVQMVALRNWAGLLRGGEMAEAMVLHLDPLAVRQVLRSSLWMLAVTSFGLAEGRLDHLFREVLNDTLPAPEAFYKALEPAADRAAPFPAGAVDREALLKRLPAIDRRSPTALLERARQADLLRLAGMTDKARTLVAKPLDADVEPAMLVCAIEYERCRGRLGFEMRFELLADRPPGKFVSAAAEGLTAVAAVLQGEERAARGDWAGALRAMDRAGLYFSRNSEPSGWSERIVEIQDLAAKRMGLPVGLRDGAAPLAPSGVGLAPFADASDEEPEESGAPDADTEGEAWIEQDLSASILESREQLMAPAAYVRQIGEWIQEWLKNPAAIRKELADMAWLDTVPRGARVKLNVPRKLEGTLASALPWELSTALDDAGVIRRAPRREGVRRYSPSAHGPPERGRVLLPRRRSRFEANTSSFGLVDRLADIYFRRCPGDVLQIGELLEDDIVRLARDFAHLRIDVVHLLATMQEAKGGFALDFSFGDRAFVKSSFGGGSDPVLGRHLEAMLHSLGSRPLVVLEIVSAGHDIADAEMLVQRNAFAEALYDPNLMRGLIATGLSPMQDGERNWSSLVDALVSGASVADVFEATRSIPFDPEGPPGQFYWPRASALWCPDPDAMALTPS